MRIQPKQFGYLGEQLAADYLQSQGYRILAQNFTIRGGEIDLIVQNSQETLLVEVKSRSNLEELEGLLTAVKIKRMRKTFKEFCQQNPEKIQSIKQKALQICLIIIDLNLYAHRRAGIKIIRHVT